MYCSKELTLDRSVSFHSSCAVRLQISLNTRDVFIEATATDLTKAKVGLLFPPCLSALRILENVATAEAYIQQNADSALMNRYLHRTALPIGGVPAEGLESCVLLPQVVLNTLCAMFSEYCSEPFVTEPVEVVDAFGQSTGSLADREWNASCPGCQRRHTANLIIVTMNLPCVLHL